MRFKVPQNVDIEDKIIGPLTGKQFLWLIGGSVIIFIAYKLCDFSLFIATTVVVGGISCAFAFLRPYGQSLIVFLSYFFIYNIKGKQYVWQRGEGSALQKQDNKNRVKIEDISYIKKEFPYKKVKKIAQVLDNPDAYVANQKTANSSLRKNKTTTDITDKKN